MGLEAKINVNGKYYVIRTQYQDPVKLQKFLSEKYPGWEYLKQKVIIPRKNWKYYNENGELRKVRRIFEHTLILENIRFRNSRGSMLKIPGPIVDHVQGLNCGEKYYLELFRNTGEFVDLFPACELIQQKKSTPVFALILHQKIDKTQRYQVHISFNIDSKNNRKKN